MRRFAPKTLLAFMMLLPLLLVTAACKDERGVKIGDTAPSLSGRDLQGKLVDPGRIKGKTVVLYFWTDSCCGNNLKLLEPFYRRHKESGLELIAVNEIDSPDAVRSYASRNQLTFTMLSDEQSALFKEYHLVGLPTVLVLDRKGVVREKVQGQIRIADLERQIERHIGN